MTSAMDGFGAPAVFGPLTFEVLIPSPAHLQFSQVHRRRSEIYQRNPVRGCRSHSAKC